MQLTATMRLCEVTIRYGTRIAVERLDLSMEGGEILGFLGPNGSGKSTTLNAIAGMLDPVSGEIRVNGLSRTESPEAFAQLVGLVTQEPSLYDELSAWDNLVLFARLYGLNGQSLRRRVEEVLDRVRMRDRAHSRLETLSGGMKRRINLACALLHDPVLLLLDEPTVALDPASRELLFEILEILRDEGRMIVLTTHELGEAEQACDRIAILNRGRLVTQGRVGEFQSSKSSVLVGQLREAIAEEIEAAVRTRLGEEVEFRVVGRRIRLRAPSGESLGLALSTLYAEGALLDSFRTPSAQLESYFLDDVPAQGEGAACPVG